MPVSRRAVASTRSGKISRRNEKPKMRKVYARQRIFSAASPSRSVIEFSGYQSRRKFMPEWRAEPSATKVASLSRMSDAVD